MSRELLAESQARLEEMQASDRTRAQAKLQRSGASVLSDYERRLLNLPSREREAQEREEAARERAARRKAVADRLRPDGIVFRTPQLERLNDHAIDLATEHGITIWLQHDGGGKAHFAERAISVPPVTNETTYITVLHELGHVLSPEADSRQHRHVITKDAMLSPDGESAAWSWALKHALVFTRQMFDFMFEALGVYYKDLATPDELDRIVTFTRWAALQIADRPLTFEQLDQQCAAISRGKAAPLHEKGASETEPDAVALRTQLAAVHAAIDGLKKRLDQIDRKAP